MAMASPSPLAPARRDLIRLGSGRAIRRRRASVQHAYPLFSCGQEPPHGSLFLWAVRDIIFFFPG
jgi:hypothetical protein